MVKRVLKTGALVLFVVLYALIAVFSVLMFGVQLAFPREMFFEISNFFLQGIFCVLWILMIEKCKSLRIYATVISIFRGAGILFFSLLFLLMSGDSIIYANLCLFPQVVYLIAKLTTPKKRLWIFTAIFGMVVFVLFFFCFHDFYFAMYEKVLGFLFDYFH